MYILRNFKYNEDMILDTKGMLLIATSIFAFFSPVLFKSVFYDNFKPVIVRKGLKNELRDNLSAKKFIRQFYFLFSYLIILFGLASLYMYFTTLFFSHLFLISMFLAFISFFFSGFFFFRGIFFKYKES